MNSAILLIDPDLGFLFWLGQLLDDNGYLAFPAKCVGEAISLIDQLDLTVTLLILNCALPGAEGFVASLRENHRHLRVISLLTDGQAPAIVGVAVDAVCRKPNRNWDSTAEWLRIVHKMLSPKLLWAIR